MTCAAVAELLATQRHQLSHFLSVFSHSKFRKISLGEKQDPLDLFENGDLPRRGADASKRENRVRLMTKISGDARSPKSDATSTHFNY